MQKIKYNMIDGSAGRHVALAGACMKYHQGPLIASLVLFLLSLWAFAGPAHAYTIETNTIEGAGGADLFPSEIELDMQPGESASRDVSITNKSGQILTIKFRIEDFRSPDDPSRDFDFFGDESITQGARKFLTPEVTSIVLRPRETFSMKVNIKIPQTADPGGYYAAIFASTSFQAPDKQPVTSESRSLFLVRISGAVVEQGNLDRPEVSRLTFKGPVGIGLIFNNLGNVHLHPSGRLIISNFRGKDVAEVPVEGWLVLPSSSRETIVNWDPGLQFGRFTVRAEIGYGNGNNPLIVSRTFWAFPWPVLLGFVILVSLLAFLLWKYIHSRREAGWAEYEVAEEELDAPEEIAPGMPVAEPDMFAVEPELPAQEVPPKEVPAFIDSSALLEEEPGLMGSETADETGAAISGEAAATEAPEKERPYIPASLEKFYTAPVERPAKEAEAGKEVPEAIDIARAPGKYIAINELFPSMHDTSIIDLSDPDTEALTKQLLYDQLNLAHYLMSQGKIEEARNQFLDARSAATHLQLFSEAGMIDDVLRWL